MLKLERKQISNLFHDNYTSIVFLIAGIIIGIFLPSTRTERRIQNVSKTLFSVAVPVPHFINPIEAMQMKGKKVNFVRINRESNQKCKIDHMPLSFNANERVGVFTGDIKSFESLVISMAEEEFNSVMIDEESSTRLPQCAHSALISYGDLEAQ